MPYFFGERSGDRVIIEGSDARHLALALRARSGETISVLQPPDALLSVRLEAVSAARVAGVVVAEAEHRPDPKQRVTIAAAMLPASALELLLARCTELGAAGFVLVSATRSVGRGTRPARWAAICREASMLAGRFSVPDRRGETRLADVSLGDATLFIGPEGGWTEAELDLARGRVLRLGRRTLRAETAAIAALAVALAAGGD